MAARLWRVGILWAALAGLYLQALWMWEWGPAEALVRPVSRAAEVLTWPARSLLSPWGPAKGAPPTPGYVALRTGFSAALWIALFEALKAWGGWAGPSRGGAAEAPRGLPEGRPGWTRRRLLVQAGAGTVAGVVGWSVGVEPASLQVRRYEIALPGLPYGLDGLRLGHVSDTHCGPFIHPDQIVEAMERLSREEPDLILFTGDYVHRTPAAIGPGVAALARGRARLGAVAVLGNHEHWQGVGACREEFARRGVPVLVNERLFLARDGLSTAPGPGAVALCGVDDLWEGEVDPARALAGVPDGMLRLLLSHNPDVAELFAGRHRFDLQFSGHTHGGQISLPLIGPPVVPSAYGARYAGGLCQGPGWPVVVSRGVGLALAPVRLGVPPEVGLIVLRRA